MQRFARARYAHGGQRIVAEKTTWSVPTIALALALFVTVSFAGGPSVAYASHPSVIGARALGMGGAFTAVVEDASALYWNPAAIGLSTGSLALSITASGVDGIAKLQQSVDDPIKFAQWKGSERAGIGGFVGLNVGPVAVGGIIDGEALVKGDVNVKKGHAEARADVAAGYARDVVGNSASGLSVRAGVVFRRATAERAAFAVDISDPTNPKLDEDERSSGQGYGLDIGVLVRASDVVTVAATARDVIGDMTWKAKGQKSKKESPTTQFRAGIAIEPPMLGGVIAADIGSGGELRYGVEKRLLFNGLAVRVGQAHRDSTSWTTLGAGIALGPVKIDAATITTDFKNYGYAVEAAIRF